MKKEFSEKEVRALLKALIQECKKIQAEAYVNAGLSGLCAEGRWEAARDALGTIDPDALMRAVTES